MIDTHCHLTDDRFAGDLELVLARAGEAGVERVITVGTGIEDGHRARELARRFPRQVSCAVGLDPFSAHRLGDQFDDALAELQSLLVPEDDSVGPHFVALGEVGIDRHYPLNPPPVQARQLLDQLEVAERVGLPVIIHVREAHDDLRRVLRDAPPVRGVIHSFTGGPDEARDYVELGWHISFNGVVTFKNAPRVREAARWVPLERLLVETDSPYLAPVPHRGRRCEPAFAAITLRYLADLRESSVTELDAHTTRNAISLFALGEH